MVLAEEVAVILAVPLIVRVEPAAGRNVTFDGATCVYPVRSSTGAGAVDVDAWGLTDALGELIGTRPLPPVNQ
jgi:hypothetical protein